MWREQSIIDTQKMLTTTSTERPQSLRTYMFQSYITRHSSSDFFQANNHVTNNTIATTEKMSSTKQQMFFQPSSSDGGSPTILATHARPLVRRDSQQIASCQESYHLFKRCADGDSELLQCDSVVKTYMRCMLGRGTNEACR